MRTKKSIKNIIFVLISNILSIMIGLVAQSLFIKILGTEYLGLNSLFSNVISLLGIVELGLGSAIIYHLYKPLAEKNIEQIKSLMSFYKKSYNIIGIIVLILGSAIIPLLRYFVNIDSITININIYYVYLLFLFDIVLSYFLSYKRSILYADQKNYILMIIHIFYTLFLNILQLLLLYLTSNYYIYLIVKVILRILENIVITTTVNNQYKYINEDSKKLDKKIEKDIFTKIKALFLHKIGGFIVLGTDNIIISRYLGLYTVGLYSNYYLIINSVQTIFTQMLTSITASVGNLLVTDTAEKQFDIFKKIRFSNYWITVFSGVSTYIIMEPFIKIWIGNDYILSNIVLLVLVINLYQKLMRNSYMIFKEAAGICYEDRFVPIIESLLNIIVSIILVKKIGLSGVFIGTIISGLALWLYSFPKFVYKKIFNRKYLSYLTETFGYIILFLLILYISKKISTIIIFNNNIFEFIKNCILAVSIPNLLLFIIFRKTENFQYLENIVFKTKISKLKQ